MITFVTLASQDNCMRDYLSLWGREIQSRIRIAHYEDVLAQPTLAPGAYILAALDQLDADSLELLTRMHQEASGRPGFRFVNDPRRTLRRGALLEELYRSGLNDFRALRATGDLASLSLPLFLRAEHNHDGPLTPLLRTRRSVDGGLGLVARRRGSLDDVLAIEFCETRDASGVYRKYSAFFVGERVIPRSLHHGRQWMLKQASTEFSLERSLEELAYVSGNPHHDQLSRIREISGVEYGRIDYGVLRGRVQTWEINLRPTIGRGALRPSSGRVPHELGPVRHQVKEIFYRGFQEGLLALDAAAGEEAADPVVIPSARRRPSCAAFSRPVHRPHRVRRWLGPLLPHVRRLARESAVALDRVAIVVLARTGRRLRAANTSRGAASPTSSGRAS